VVGRLAVLTLAGTTGIRQQIPPTSEIRTIVECKYLSRNVERAEVDALRTVVNETQCHKGVILSRVGFQKGAIAAATARGRLLTPVVRSRR
jgi:hypothetical protein